MFISPKDSDKTNLDQLGDQLLQALASAATAQLDGLQQTRDTQVTLGALLQNEAQRLQKKYGADHGRIQQINTSLQRNIAVVKDLEVELEIVNIRQPDVDDKAALVQGRVIDQNNRGITGLVVFLGDEQGKPLRFLGTAETDLSGYYALSISPETLAKLGETAPNGVFLGVCTRQGRVVYQQPETILLKSGDRITLEVTLKREDLSPVDGGKPVEPSGEDWVVRGQVSIVTGQPVVGVRVNAIDNNRRFDDKLGFAITDSKGNFQITYAFQSPHDPATERGPDLYVTVIDEAGKLLFSSQRELRQNAGRDEEFKIAIASTTPPTPSPTPTPPPTPPTPGQPNIALDGSVLWFETRSTKLRQDDRLNGDRLLKLAQQRAQQFLKQNPNGQAILHGYASSNDGTREEALALSQRRAEVIQAQLVQANLSTSQLTVTAHGLDTTYPETLLNQRVEIVLSATRVSADRPPTRPTPGKDKPK